MPIQHIHPMIVHFPIVFMLSLAVFDVVCSARGLQFTGRSAAGNLSAGLAVLIALFAGVAFGFGDMALEYAEAGGFHSDVAEVHETLGTVFLIVTIIWAALRAFLWYRDSQAHGAVRLIIPLVELCLAGLVVTLAFYGGQLVYDLGVNVTHM